MNLSTQSIKLNIILAINDSNNGIGYKGKLPWNLKDDLVYFSKVTRYTRDPLKKNAIIMGRKTWDSIGKILPGRINIIVSGTMINVVGKEYLIYKSLNEAIIDIVENYTNIVESIFVIGGLQLYEEALKYTSGFLNNIFVTRIYGNYECDVFMPMNFLKDFEKYNGEKDENTLNYDVSYNFIKETNNIKFCFEIYKKKVFN